jgi:hypothetical protein
MDIARFMHIRNKLGTFSFEDCSKVDTRLSGRKVLQGILEQEVGILEFF